MLAAGLNGVSMPEELINLSDVNSEPVPGCEVHTTPQELAAELTVLTGVDWRKVWPGAGGGYEPDPAWLAQFNWEVVNFQWRTNDWGPITVQTRTGKRHYLSTTTSHSMEYAYASHRLWTGSAPDKREKVHDREAAEAAAAWEEYVASAQGVLGARHGRVPGTVPASRSASAAGAEHLTASTIPTGLPYGIRKVPSLQ